MTNRLADYLRQ